MVASRPFPTVALLSVVLAMAVAGCGAREDTRPPGTAITPASTVPSTAAAPSTVPASRAPVATPVASDPGVSTASMAGCRPRGRPSLRRCGSASGTHPAPSWVALADAPGLLELAYAPDWTAGDDPPVFATPRVAVGVPVGLRTVADVLTWFRSRPVTMGCPELVTPGPIGFAGLSGTGFACSGDSKGATRLYRIAGP